jgi:cysteinyl-tRNA synthetase
MALTVYNTLRRRKEPFAPLDAPKVGMYVCGLTVYDYAHIGHARTAVAFEVIRRWLEYRGYNVLFVQNVTDVDDKIIKRANELGRDPQEHAAEWTRICAKDMHDLGVPPADLEPRVTQHMPQIIRLVERLVGLGAAYVADDGSVYFSVASKADYGKLSNRTPDEMRAGARVEPAAGKRDPKDFALWKASKPGEPAWESPWGAGRPGWHIECSAMSMTYLGESFDIHGGGVDLVFPHHENEIAQSEGATGKPFATYWLHTGFLSVDGEKMSKSLGNFVTIQDILTKEDPEVVRFFYAHTHYRSSIDFSQDALAEAGRGLERLHRVRRALEDAVAAGSALGDGDGELEAARVALEEEFGRAMDDDFNTREAIAGLFGFVTAANKAVGNGVGAVAAAGALATFAGLARVLTVLEPAARPAAAGDALTAPLVDLLLEVRQEARKQKLFELADRIRDELARLGVEVSDTKEGSAWRQVR